jgi:hypothetical protein
LRNEEKNEEEERVLKDKKNRIKFQEGKKANLSVSNRIPTE